MSNCRIYAACLASYNNGRLHGAWIDCDGQDGDGIMADIAAMLRDSPYPNVMVDCPLCDGDGKKTFHNSETGDTRKGDCPTCGGKGQVPSAEEWAIHDHEGFGKLLRGENPDLDEVAALAEGLSGEYAAGFAFLVDNNAMKPSDALDECSDVIAMSVNSGISDERALGDYAAELYEDELGATENLPDIIRYNIDWQGIGRDLQIGGDICLFEFDGDRYVIGNAACF